MRSAAILLVLFVLHTLSLWDTKTFLVGSLEDPAAHAAMPGWYCSKILRYELTTDRYFAPAGANLGNSFDSPFPLILTCPFQALGSHAQFHIFAAMELFLILLSAWLVARTLTANWLWQLAYVGLVWWSGFYLARTHQHYTLFPSVWGFQFLLWMAMTVDLRRRGQMIGYGLIAGLIFAGTAHNLALLSLPTLVIVGFALYQQRAQIRSTKLNLALMLLACFAIFTVLFLPALMGYMQGGLVRLVDHREKYSYDLLGPIIPWAENPIWRWTGWTPPQNLEEYNGFDLLVVAILIWAAKTKRFFTHPLAKPLLWIGLFGWIAAIGPIVRFNDIDLFENPLDVIFAEAPLLGISRTPGRFAVLTCMSMTFIAFTALNARTQKPWVAGVLVVWVALTGPIANGIYVLPGAKLNDHLPMKALNEIASRPGDDIVVNIPTDIRNDPTQNLLQLIHGKRITAGYLSYLANTPEQLRVLREDPMLSQVNCGDQEMGFRGEGVMGDYLKARAWMHQRQFKYVIVNKRSLMWKSCEGILAWARGLTEQPWVKVLEESSLYAVMEIY